MRDDALTLAEQIRQHAGVFDGNFVGEVREDEAHLQITWLALDAALDHHAADAKTLGERRVARDHLAGIAIKHDVLARGPDPPRHRRGHPAQDAEYHVQTFTARRHCASLAAMASARTTFSRAAFSERRAAHRFQSRTTPVIPKQGHT